MANTPPERRLYRPEFDEPKFSLEDFIEMIITAHKLGVSLDKTTREEVLTSLKEILALQEHKQ